MSKVKEHIERLREELQEIKDDGHTNTFEKEVTVANMEYAILMLGKLDDEFYKIKKAFEIIKGKQKIKWDKEIAK